MRALLFAIIMVIAVSCSQRKNDYQQVLHNPVLYSKVTGLLTEVITYDIFTPPVASRIYAYAHLAAYETMARGDSSYTSLQGQLKDFAGVPAPEAVTVKVGRSDAVACSDDAKEMSRSSGSNSRMKL